jgi:hypothetical protein
MLDRKLRRVISFVTGRDFDLYAILCLGLVLTGVEIGNGSWTTALFAGVLATFAISLLRLRQDVGHLRSGKVGFASVFLHETPSNVPLSFEQASELLLVGVSLDRTLRNAYASLETFLTRQGVLRVLLVDPNAEWAVRTADRRAYQELTPELRKQAIENSITRFQGLREKTQGNVEIRVIDDPLVFGATMIDGDRNTEETRIVIQHYSFKKREAREPNPVFVVRPTDEGWFAEFKEELENLWSHGEAV